MPVLALSLSEYNYLKLEVYPSRIMVLASEEDDVRS